MIWGSGVEAFRERTAMGQAPHLAHFTSRSFISGIATNPRTGPSLANGSIAWPFLTGFALADD
jgi:hypothetical protein